MTKRGLVELHKKVDITPRHSPTAGRRGENPDWWWWSSNVQVSHQRQSLPLFFSSTIFNLWTPTIKDDLDWNSFIHNYSTTYSIESLNQSYHG